MEVRKDEFPIVVQAYDASAQPEVFIAEQVVNSQAEIDNFTSRYAGALIKARPVSKAEVETRETHTFNRAPSRSSGGWWIFFIVLIIALVVVGFATGWIQETFNVEF